VVAAGEGESGLSYPVTIKKVWMRARYDAEKSASSTGKGDLVIHRDRIEYLHGKDAWELPWERVRMISIRKKKGDVDTDWVFLGVSGPDREAHVALRDGRKFGFGKQTDQILATLRAAARGASAAQYAVPEGFVVYEALDHMFTIGLPAEWKAIHPSADVEDGVVRTGTVTFFEPPGPVTGREERAEVGRRAPGEAARGAWLNVSVERRPAEKGMDPDGLADGVVADLRTEVETDPAYLGGLRTEAELEVAPATVDRRNGVRIRGSGRDETGASRHLELIAVADAGLLYLFRSVADDDHMDSGTEILETVIETVRFRAGP
jgi:hypothetical protein